MDAWLEENLYTYAYISATDTIRIDHTSAMMTTSDETKCTGSPFGHLRFYNMIHRAISTGNVCYVVAWSIIIPFY